MKKYILCWLILSISTIHAMKDGQKMQEVQHGSPTLARSARRRKNKSVYSPTYRMNLISARSGNALTGRHKCVLPPLKQLSVSSVIDLKNRYKQILQPPVKFVNTICLWYFIDVLCMFTVTS